MTDYVTSGGGLPGVLNSHESTDPGPIDFDAPVEVDGQDAAGSAKAKDTPATPKAPGEAAAQDDASEVKPAEGEETPEPEQTDAAQPFQFAGKDFKSQAAAEHYVRSQEGRVKALTKRLGEYVDYAKNRQEYDAQAAARGGKTEPRQAPQPNDAGQPDLSKQEKAELKDWLDDNELWDFYEELSEEKGPRYAAYMLAKKMREQTRGELQQLIRDEVGPLKQERQAAQGKQLVMELFQGQADRRDDAGAYIYPELRSEDDNVTRAIVRIWRTFPPALAISELGVRHAVLEYRSRNPQASATKPKPTPGAPGAEVQSGGGSRVTEALRAAVEGGAEAVTGSGTPRPSNGNREPDLATQITSADSFVKDDEGRSLGFTRRGNW